MKENTLLFYEQVVQTALLRIVRSMDDALDLTELAHGAALSPLHFHRIFRGMLGETPLELHRRLRLERAAWRLSTGRERVTTIAFEAGYETHEAFTRAFRDAYGASPREFRERARTPPRSGDPIRACELAAACGVHFRDPPDPELRCTLQPGEHTMKVDIETLPERRVAAVAHVGPYDKISAAFARLGEIAERAGLLSHPGLAMVAVYQDDPESKPEAELRSEAGLVVPDGIALPSELHELRLTAGRYARTTHLGPYAGLGDAWQNFCGPWLAHSGHRAGTGPSFELYRNTPMNAQPSELVTDLYMPIV